MIQKFISKFIKLAFLFCFFTLNFSSTLADENLKFNKWLTEYKDFALNEGVSKTTIKNVFKNVKFLPQVIKYDRKQPEFFEDTLTYISKRATKNRKNKAISLLSKNKNLFNEVETKFKVEKEILLALWGIETNFGKHVGKMDIISSLATLSYDQRRSEFFSKQLLILIKLVDKNLINVDELYGSWAGAYGNFQFMPSTISNYAIDYDNNKKIELKFSLNDALASAANYINKIGWKYNEPCFYKVNLTEQIEKKYINTSARNISNKLKISKWIKKGVVISSEKLDDENKSAALILPDNKEGSPAYLVFSNYEKILKWNRSLRFGITVCTLANNIKNEIY
jgi:membrane-bound lytic murein transglycosylase B